MIDVIIPAYNAHDTIMSTILSVYYQTLSDKCNVYICNDCSDHDYKDIVDFFDGLIKVSEVKLDVNSGPGVARQKGIEASSSEYITFIDSDDVFASPYALETLKSKIEKNNLDMVIGEFLEETPDSYKTRSNDTVWLHGKMYRRSFIEDHHVMFNETRANEDNGFNQSILLRDPKFEFVKQVIYHWRHNPNSITRKNNYLYKYSGLIGYVYNITWALKSAIEDNAKYDNIAELSTACLDAMYYYYLEFMDEEDSIELLKNTVDVYKINKEYPIKDENIANDIHKKEYEYFLEDLTKEKILNPKISFEEFKQLIEEVSP